MIFVMNVNNMSKDKAAMEQLLANELDPVFYIPQERLCYDN